MQHFRPLDAVLERLERLAADQEVFALQMRREVLALRWMRRSGDRQDRRRGLRLRADA